MIRLLHKVALRLSLLLLPLISLWAMVFYFVMVDEINDEADDFLEVYAQQLMVRKLRGEDLEGVQGQSRGNPFTLREVPGSYEPSLGVMEYYDDDFLQQESGEMEPARYLRIIFRDKNQKYYELIVSTPTFEKDELIRTVLGWVLALYVLLLASVLAAALLVLQRSMKPLYRILDYLGAYTPGVAHEALKVETDVYEFNQLFKVASEAVGRSDEAYEKQKQFIGNASHELQTPLAILLGRVDWLLDSESLDEESMGEMVQIRQELVRLSHLNRTLLLLTKIDNGQFPELTRVDITALVQEEKQRFEEIFSSRQIRCHFLSDVAFLQVSMNETLARVLVSNLIKNAFVHTPEPGEVVIRLEKEMLTVENTGSGSLDAERVFERFFQGAKKEGSTGLGLALASSVAQKSGMRLTYEFRNQRHCFRLLFHP